MASDEPVLQEQEAKLQQVNQLPEDDAQSVTQNEPKLETIVKPW